jgi:GT2 family glycosyltransferase
MEELTVAWRSANEDHAAEVAKYVALQSSSAEMVAVRNAQIESLNSRLQEAERSLSAALQAASRKDLEILAIHESYSEKSKRLFIESQEMVIESEQRWQTELNRRESVHQRQIELERERIDRLTKTIADLNDEHAKRELQAVAGLRDEHERAVDALNKAWAGKLEHVNARLEQERDDQLSRLKSLTAELEAAKAGVHRQQIAYLERAVQVSRDHALAQGALTEKFVTARENFVLMKQERDLLEAENRRLKSRLITRVKSAVGSVMRGLLGRKMATGSSNVELHARADESGRGEFSTTDAESQQEVANDAFSDEDLLEILKTGMFDRDFYLAAYSDVAAENADPLQHYMVYGWKEGRNPSSKFDTAFYLEAHPDVRDSGMNPLVHFIRFGRNEGRNCRSIDDLTDLSIWRELIDDAQLTVDIQGRPSIDIIVPVYNGLEYLEPLFRSIAANTSRPYRLIVVEDASPDSRVRVLLKQLLSSFGDDTVLLENEQNAGFVRSVNRAVKETRDHFVILNSDTEVPPGWLDRLMKPILEMDKIASTTPFTNSGTICSFPRFVEDNPIFEGLELELVDKVFQKVRFQQNTHTIPSGVGFCMGVNKDVVAKIGMFDEVFGKGYGEENDWCLRAQALGYSNVLVPNLFVYHKHGGSFPSTERTRLIARNLQILFERHPTYERDVQEFIKKDRSRVLRELLVMCLAGKTGNAVLVLDNELGGGAHQYRKTKVAAWISEGKPVFLVSYAVSDDSAAKLQFYFRSFKYVFAIRNHEDIVSFAGLVRFSEIWINSFVSFGNVEEWLVLIGRLRETSRAKLVYLLHDFFAVCPSYTLIDDHQTFCGVPSDLKICEACLPANIGDFKRFEKSTDLIKWRGNWGKFLQICDEIVCFGDSSVAILRKAYPHLSAEKVVLRRHDIAGRLRNIYRGGGPGTIRNVGVLGAINMAKGSHVVRDLVEYIDQQKIDCKVVLFGEIDIRIDSMSFEETGRYELDNLEALVEQKNIDVFLLPSIWPETYSFTADEIMQMGFPLIAFDLGAPAERIKGYPLGKVIARSDLYQTLFGLHSSDNDRRDAFALSGSSTP